MLTDLTISEISSNNLHNPQKKLSLLKYLIRKWMVEIFTGVLKLPALMFIFDQLLMNNFKINVLEDVSLSLVLLLREDLRKCTDYTTFIKVFILQKL